MKYFIFLGVSMLVLSMGCKQHIEEEASQSWSNLTIFSERDTRITMGNDADSSVVTVYHRGSFFAPLPKGEKMKVDTIKAFFTRAEKDTIFSLVHNLITHPAKTKGFCTEFVGSLELLIDYGNQFKQIAKYSSVCNWNSLSDKTMRLHDILRSKIKKIYLGENDTP